MHRGLLLALAAYVWWGLSPIYWKLGGDVPAGDTIAFRVMATAVLLWAAQAFRGNLGVLRAAFADPRTRWTFVATAVLLSSNWLTFVWAVGDDRVLEASLGYFVNPLLSVLLGVVFLRETLRPAQWAALAIAGLGVVLLTIDVGTLPWVSLFLAVTFGLYGLLRKTAPMGSLDGLTLEVSLMVPVASVVIAWRAGIGAGVVGWSVPARDLWLLGTGLVTAVPLLLFASAARRTELWRVGLMQYVAPTLQFLLGVLVYDESWSGGQVLGYLVIWFALIVFATESVVAARRSTRELAPSSDARPGTDSFAP